MIRSRIFRLRSFWFGLMGLLFLVWAWRDSTTHQSGIHVNRMVLGEVGRVILPDAIDQFAGGIMFEWREPLDGGRFAGSFSGFEFSREKYQASSCFPVPEILTSPPMPLAPGIFGVLKTLVIPHWLLALLYVPVWAAVIQWRWKAAGKRDAALGPSGTFEAP